MKRTLFMQSFKQVIYIVLITLFLHSVSWAEEKKIITAIYIPLADHYPGIVAYEKYKGKMKKADYRIEHA
ncbi:MAG: hypothetical protein GY714_17555 [Desulfobacterales bacterium]|nr:hypothetical protein [Desulfobacterales bacterium]MCP4162876.1 hypothetical protein [Deltaproteobacteria bacterium]